MVSNTTRCGWANRLYQLFIGGGAHSFCTAELAQEFLDRFGPDAGHIMQLRGEPCRVPPSAMERDSETMRLVTHRLDQMQYR